jgi:hypothetical protein
MCVAANMAVGLINGDIVPWVQMVSKRVASDASTYDCNLHA